MDHKVALVLKGYVELNSTQRQEFVAELNKFINGTNGLEVVKKSIRESVQGSTVNFGPSPTGCPCCGR